MDKQLYYAHRLLISLTHQEDERFEQSVVYVYQHNEHGASGVIINRELDSKLGELLSQLEIPYNQDLTNISNHPVLFGGPTNTENGFIIYPRENTRINQEKNGDAVDPLVVTPARDTLEEIACGYGPEKFILLLGYCSWDAGQLEQEMCDNKWLIAPYDEKILFDAPEKQKRNLAAKLVGFDLLQLSSQVGHG